MPTKKTGEESVLNGVDYITYGNIVDISISLNGKLSSAIIIETTKVNKHSFSYQIYCTVKTGEVIFKRI